MIFDIEKKKSHEDQAEYEVEKIIAEALNGKRKVYLIKWKGYAESENTWQPKCNLINALDKIRVWKNAKAQLSRDVEKLNSLDQYEVISSKEIYRGTRQKSQHIGRYKNSNKRSQISNKTKKTKNIKKFQERLKKKPKVWQKQIYQQLETKSKISNNSDIITYSREFEYKTNTIYNQEQDQIYIGNKNYLQYTNLKDLEKSIRDIQLNQAQTRSNKLAQQSSAYVMSPQRMVIEEMSCQLSKLFQKNSQKSFNTSHNKIKFESSSCFNNNIDIININSDQQIIFQDNIVHKTNKQTCQIENIKQGQPNQIIIDHIDPQILQEQKIYVENKYIHNYKQNSRLLIEFYDQSMQFYENEQQLKGNQDLFDKLIQPEAQVQIYTKTFHHPKINKTIHSKQIETIISLLKNKQQKIFKVLLKDKREVKVSYKQVKKWRPHLILNFLEPFIIKF